MSENLFNEISELFTQLPFLLIKKKLNYKIKTKLPK